MLGYLGFYEYRVIAQTAERLDLQVTERGLGLPDLVRVAVRPGAAGHKAELAQGALVLVGFVNGDDKRPFVAFYDAPGGAGFTPSTSTLDASGTVRVGPSASAVELAHGSATIASVGDEAGRVVRFGDSIMVPVGSPPVLTAVPVIGSAPGATVTPVAPFSASKVTA